MMDWLESLFRELDSFNSSRAIKKKHTQLVCVAHNLSGYDGFLLARPILRLVHKYPDKYSPEVSHIDNRYYSLKLIRKITKGGTTRLTFMCSYLLIPEGLDKLARTFFPGEDLGKHANVYKFCTG